ncbi:Type IV pilus biogenesis and competence protein PilQ [Pandoraea morbifera]|uniref:Type IV pilus biogenesis and competence protein PilQ n=2 Tax=Pandoraea morbifera TaxID=2508300 RepID=A0A5E4XAG4_9BURK|nr:Type IV pilus biogenesis and competence protein PilQ [Pandoraea morbifera]
MHGDSNPPDDVRDMLHEVKDRWRAHWHAWMSVPPAEWPRAVRWGLAGAAWAIGLALAWSIWWLVGLPARATLQKELAVAQQVLDRANHAARRLPTLMQTLRDAQAQAMAWRRLLPAADVGPTSGAVASTGDDDSSGPSDDPQSGWRTDLERLLARSGLTLSSARPGPSASKGEIELERAEMRVQGEVAQLLRWLAEIDQTPRHLAVERFSLEGAGMGALSEAPSTLTITVAAYRWRRPADLVPRSGGQPLPALPEPSPPWQMPQDTVDVFRAPLTRRPAQDAVTMAASGPAAPAATPVGAMRAGSRRVVLRQTSAAGLAATWSDVLPPRGNGVRVEGGGVTHGEDAGDVDVTLHGVPAADALRAFARLTGRSIVIGEHVAGRIDMEVKGVTAATAFDVMVRSAGLGVQSVNGVDWVAPRADLLADEQTRLEAAFKREALLPLASRRFVLNYPRALALREIILGEKDSKGQRLLSPRGNLIADPRTNQLFVTDLPEKLEALASFIARIDVPVRQVLIEARIVEADDRFSESLGVRLAARDGGAVGQARGTGAGSGGGSGTSRDAAGGQGARGESGADDRLRGSGVDIGLSAAALAGVVPPSLAITLFGRSATRFLQLELSALETSGRGRVVSRPRIVTADKIQAVIEQGTELPYQTRSGRRSAASIQFRKATLRLEVTPLITPDGQVILDVDVRKDSVGQQVAEGFAVDTRHVKTQVQVENGGTVAIGGIYQEERRDRRASVPWLGDVPLLGALFRNRSNEDRRTELLVFLTPSVVPGSVPDEAGAMPTPSQVPPRETSGAAPGPTTTPSSPSQDDLPTGHRRLTGALFEATRSARPTHIPVLSGVGTQISAIYAGKRNTCRTDGGGQDHGWTRGGTTSGTAVL